MSNEEQQNVSEKIKKLKISATEEMKRGTFANYAIVYHSNEEFSIDFILRIQSEGTLNARVILAPSHFKRFMKALDVNLKRYEKKFGKIPENIVELKTKVDKKVS